MIYKATAIGNVPLTPEEEAELTQLEQDYLVSEPARLEEKRKENLQKLWQAATDYQTSYISDMAIGILTIGVIQGLPKALAVKAWANVIWNDLYYPRKLLITHEYSPEFYDFSTVGPMPHTVPELNAEIGG